MGWGLRQFSSTSNIWVSRYTCEQAYLRTRLGMIMSACGHEMHGQWSLKWRKSSLKPKMKVSKLYLYIFLVCILGLFINFEYMSLWVYVSLSICPIYYTNRKYKLCCVLCANSYINIYKSSMLHSLRTQTSFPTLILRYMLQCSLYFLLIQDKLVF
jgi:hypothetical protein